MAHIPSDRAQRQNASRLQSLENEIDKLCTLIEPIRADLVALRLERGSHHPNLEDSPNPPAAHLCTNRATQTDPVPHNQVIHSHITANTAPPTPKSHHSNSKTKIPFAGHTRFVQRAISKRFNHRQKFQDLRHVSLSSLQTNPRFSSSFNFPASPSRHPIVAPNGTPQAGTVGASTLDSAVGISPWVGGKFSAHTTETSSQISRSIPRVNGYVPPAHEQPPQLDVYSQRNDGALPPSHEILPPKNYILSDHPSGRVKAQSRAPLPQVVRKIRLLNELSRILDKIQLAINDSRMERVLLDFEAYVKVLNRLVDPEPDIYAEALEQRFGNYLLGGLHQFKVIQMPWTLTNCLYNFISRFTLAHKWMWHPEYKNVLDEDYSDLDSVDEEEPSTNSTDIQSSYSNQPLADLTRDESSALLNQFNRAFPTQLRHGNAPTGPTSSSFNNSTLANTPNFNDPSLTNLTPVEQTVDVGSSGSAPSFLPPATTTQDREARVADDFRRIFQSYRLSLDTTEIDLTIGSLQFYLKILNESEFSKELERLKMPVNTYHMNILDHAVNVVHMILERSELDITAEQKEQILDRFRAAYREVWDVEGDGVPNVPSNRDFAVYSTNSRPLSNYTSSVSTPASPSSSDSFVFSNLSSSPFINTNLSGDTLVDYSSGNSNTPSFARRSYQPPSVQHMFDSDEELSASLANGREYVDGFDEMELQRYMQRHADAQVTGQM